MIKRIGLSAAAIFAVVGLAAPQVAMARDRDDYRREVRSDRDHRARIEYRYDRRDRFDRDFDHDRDWR